ncbi:TPR repeat-containing protein [Caballeronia terrestris]|uniref:TPR repeat-containing protein n=1 Tax=Caballeronia terrestris TaxID=1226301 RepID=A0A158K8Y0_9BURK|nr:TPR repeat-containing protein [Caballeronia terrestris]
MPKASPLHNQPTAFATRSRHERQRHVRACPLEVERLVAAGFDSPSGERRDWRFTFHAVVMLRTAQTRRRLAREGCPRPRSPVQELGPRRVAHRHAHRGRRQPRHREGRDKPKVRCRNRSTAFGLRREPAASNIASLQAPLANRAREVATNLLYRAWSLEDEDIDAPEAACREAFARVPDYTDASLNFDILIACAGFCGCTTNAARIHESAWRRGEAIRHFSASRNLQKARNGGMDFATRLLKQRHGGRNGRSTQARR